MKVYRFCDKLNRGEENYYKDFQPGLLTTYNAV